MDSDVSSLTRIAVLIDADNVSARHASDVLEELARYGTPTVKRAYGDWTTTQLTGWTGMEDTARAVAGRLREGSIVIVRDGPRGCVVREGERTAYVPGFPQTPVDTNGAGDCHTGVLLAGRLAGLSWPEAARRANAGAALKVTRRGPNTAPSAAEIDDFLRGA